MTRHESHVTQKLEPVNVALTCFLLLGKTNVLAGSLNLSVGKRFM